MSEVGLEGKTERKGYGEIKARERERVRERVSFVIYWSVYVYCVHVNLLFIIMLDTSEYKCIRNQQYVCLSEQI